MIQKQIQELFPNLNVTTYINNKRISVEAAQSELFYYNIAHDIMRMNSISIETALRIKELYIATLSKEIVHPNKPLLD